jgi:hypothetical protein
MVLIGAVNTKMNGAGLFPRRRRRRHGAPVDSPVGLNLAYDTRADEVLIEN